MVWVGVISQRLKRTLLKYGFILRVVECWGETLLQFKLVVTLIRGSKGCGIQSVSELEPVLGLCRCQNLVFDLQQEAPYFFAAQLKSDYDYGVTRTEKKSYVGEPLSKCLLITSVGETDSDSGVTWTEKKRLCGSTLCKILVAYFS